MQEIVEAVELLGNAPWSTRIAEQGHVAVSRLNRLHKEYSTTTLTARATLMSMRPFFLITDEEKRLARAERKVEALRRKNPNKINAKTVYVKALLDKANTLKKHGRLVP